MQAAAKKNSRQPSVKAMVENIIGCKWSLTVLDLVRKGIDRPGAMERAVEGLTTKVLNERLRKLVRYRILEKKTYPEVPPRVEYKLTRFGKRFLKLLDEIDRLEADLAAFADEN
ncbi:MAG: helix-turn-helix transcriptional regulator [Acidobacteria bacterium]|nr:helix-turn-helix transcriptional regulator [Acidobacteriota bacterium]